MSKFELIGAIFGIVIVIYVAIMGIRFLLKKTGKSDKDIVAASKDRNPVQEETVVKNSTITQSNVGDVVLDNKPVEMPVVQEPVVQENVTANSATMAPVVNEENTTNQTIEQNIEKKEPTE